MDPQDFLDRQPGLVGAHRPVKVFVSEKSYMDGLLLRNVTQGCPLTSICTPYIYTHTHTHTHPSDMLYTAANNCQAKSIQVVQGRSHVNDSFEL